MSDPIIDNIPSPFYRVSIKAIIFYDDDRLLVAQAGDGKWELPGGGWEHEETMEVALDREVTEEFGVSITSADFSVVYPYYGLTEKGHASLKLAVLAKLDSHKFTLEPSLKAYRFVTADELRALIMNSDEQGIQQYIDRIWPKNSVDTSIIL